MHACMGFINHQNDPPGYHSSAARRPVISPYVICILTPIRTSAAQAPPPNLLTCAAASTTDNSIQQTTNNTKITLRTISSRALLQLILVILTMLEPGTTSGRGWFPSRKALETHLFKFAADEGPFGRRRPVQLHPSLTKPHSSMDALCAFATDISCLRVVVVLHAIFLV